MPKESVCLSYRLLPLKKKTRIYGWEVGGCQLLTITQNAHHSATRVNGTMDSMATCVEMILNIGFHWNLMNKRDMLTNSKTLSIRTNWKFPKIRDYHWKSPKLPDQYSYLKQNRPKRWYSLVCLALFLTLFLSLYLIFIYMYSLYREINFTSNRYFYNQSNFNKFNIGKFMYSKQYNKKNSFFFILLMLYS